MFLLDLEVLLASCSADNKVAILRVSSKSTHKLPLKRVIHEYFCYDFIRIFTILGQIPLASGYYLGGFIPIDCYFRIKRTSYFNAEYIFKVKRGQLVNLG